MTVVEVVADIVVDAVVLVVVLVLLLNFAVAAKVLLRSDCTWKEVLFTQHTS